jgi:hypothetical protein
MTVDDWLSAVVRCSSPGSDELDHERDITPATRAAGPDLMETTNRYVI